MQSSLSKTAQTTTTAEWKGNKRYKMVPTKVSYTHCSTRHYIVLINFIIDHKAAIDIIIYTLLLSCQRSQKSSQ
jgi:hypothetical protein